MTRADNYFAVVPEFVIFGEISGNAVRLYAILRRYADREDRAHPSLKTLSEGMRCSVDTVRRATEELEGIGALRVEPRYTEGRQTSNDYVLLTLPRGSTGARDGGSTGARDGGSTGARGGTRAIRTRAIGTRENQELVSPGTTNGTSTTFGEAWIAYPRKTAKGAASKAWAKAVQRATPAVIMEGIRTFAADPNREDEFTPHLSTWLNQDRWEDGPLPARSGPRDNAARIVGQAMAEDSPLELGT